MLDTETTELLLNASHSAHIRWSLGASTTTLLYWHCIWILLARDDELVCCIMKALEGGLNTSQQDSKDTDELFLILLFPNITACTVLHFPSISVFKYLPASLPPLPTGPPWSLTAHLPPSLSTPHHTACTGNSFPAEVEHEIRLACRCW